MVAQSTWCARSANNPDGHEIENVLAVDMLNQRLKVLTNCNAVLDLNGVVIILAIFKLLLAIGEYEHPAEQVKPCCKNRLVKSIEHVGNLCMYTRLIRVLWRGERVRGRT